jgi:hypothetical protein
MTSDHEQKIEPKKANPMVGDLSIRELSVFGEREAKKT